MNLSININNADLIYSCT